MFEGPMAHLPPGRTTRSMRRLERTRNFHMDSPALSAIGTPLSHNKPSFRDSTVSFRLRAVSHYSINELHLTRVLEREFDNDLLYAEFCLECVWVEPRKEEPSYPACRAFLSKSFIGHTYMNYMMRPPESIKGAKSQLRSIRLIEVEKSFAISGNLSVMECVDAAPMKDDSTVVLFNHHISIYSGIARTTDVFITCQALSSSPQWQRSVFIPSAIDDTFSLVVGKSIYHLTIPPMYSSKDVQLLFATILEALPQDKAMRLAGEWRSHTPTAQRGTIYSNIHNTYLFVLKSIGFDIPTVIKMRMDSETDELDETQAKQRRPLRSADQNWKQILSYGIDCQVNPFSSYNVRVAVNPAALLYSNIYITFSALHAHWENMSLERGQKNLRSSLVFYLYSVVKLLKLDAYIALYEKVFPKCKDLQVSMTDDSPKEFPSPHGLRNFNPNRVLSIWVAVEMFLKEVNVSPLPLCAPLTARILLAIGIGLARIKTLNDIQRHFGKNWTKRLKFSSEDQSKFLEKFLNTKESLSFKCVWTLRVSGMGLEDVDRFPPYIALLFGKIVHSDQTAVDTLVCRTSKLEVSFPTTHEFWDIATARWSVDKRLMNVKDMLSKSSCPVLINTESLGLADTDLKDAQELFLSGASIRYLVQSMGSAFLNFRTTTPTLSVSHVDVPKLCLTARLFPSNTNFEITINDTLRPFREWGDFYNGVSSALRFADSSQVKVDGEWIMAICNNTEKFTPATKAGILYGLGLNGHIVNTNMFDVHDLLAAVEDFQSVALILGYAASSIGTNDSRIFRMITTQLPFLMGPTLLPIMITPLIQTASVSAIGLVFAESGHINITKKLVNEIGRSSNPEDVPFADRYAYKLSAGFSVGLICLSLGNQMLESDPCFIEPQSSIVKRLTTMMNGGPRDMCVFPQHNNTTSDFIHSGVNQFTPDPSSHVWEKENINTHLTSHPATIALGLMFFQTNNTYMADLLSLPQTISLLEGIRPDLVLIRVLCRNLILWNDIKSTKEWVESQVPEIVSSYLKSSLKWGDDEDSILTEEEDKYWESIVDRETLAQIYLYAVTGACFALTLKHVAHPSPTKRVVSDVIYTYVNMIEPTQKKKLFVRLAEHAGANVLSLCMNTLLTCLAMLHAGEGDVQPLRLARLWRMQGSVLSWSRNIRKHQEQLAAHQAMGMLFMGTGSCGFKNDKLSLALLLISFYPVICHNITDNRFYHQPLRFLWARTVERRLLVPVCPETMKPVKCDVKLYYLNCTEPQEESGPVLLPNLDFIEFIEIGGKKHELVRINFKVPSERKAFEQTLLINFGRVKIRPSDAYKSEILTKDWVDLSWNAESIFGLMDVGEEGEEEDVPEGVLRHDPLLTVDEPNDLRWSSLESLPVMSRHLRSCQTNIVHAKNPNQFSTDIEMVQTVAEWAGETQLAYQLETELSRVQDRFALL
ncbi:unnamed protein product [Auanema sp. JU1783]|nr:unnamed protein product [Auanema sp. JU1783]